MRLLSFIRALIAAFFSRATVILIFWTITTITCAQVMLRSSVAVGLTALVACALCYAGASGFMGSLLARREKGYRAIDLAAIGTLAVLLIAAGSALMVWSGFSIRLFDVHLSGLTWALLGTASAVVVVRIKDALK